MMIIYIAGFQAIPEDMMEAAKIDGANRWQTLFKITIPNMMPSITICTFMTLTNGFKLFDQNLALTAGQPFQWAADGSVVTHANEEYLPNEEGNTILSEQVNINIEETQDINDIATFTDYDGKSKFVAIGSVETTGWNIGVTLDESVIRSEVMSKIMMTVIASVVILVITIALLIMLVHKILSPVKEIEVSLAKIAEGDLSAQISKSDRKDEIGVLQNTINKLIGMLTNIIIV